MPFTSTVEATRATGSFSISPNLLATGTAWKTGSSRLYGPPASVRVVRALARLLASAFMRERSALRPEAVISIALKKSMILFPSAAGAVVGRVPQHCQLLCHDLHGPLEADIVGSQLRHLVLEAD